VYTVGYIQIFFNFFWKVWNLKKFRLNNRASWCPGANSIFCYDTPLCATLVQYYSSRYILQSLIMRAWKSLLFPSFANLGVKIDRGIWGIFNAVVLGIGRDDERGMAHARCLRKYQQWDCERMATSRQVCPNGWTSIFLNLEPILPYPNSSIYRALLVRDYE
jgi:hypothetical protein